MKIQKPADLARIVKTRRQAQGLTQQDIADAVGITRQSLARIERGHAGASFDTILRIFDKLGIHLEVASSGQRHPSVPLSSADVLRNIDISAVIAAAMGDIDTSAIAAAAAGNIDTNTLLPEWRAKWRHLSTPLQAIEARDPDHEGSTTTGEERALKTAEGEGDG